MQILITNDGGEAARFNWARAFALPTHAQNDGRLPQAIGQEAA